MRAETKSKHDESTDAWVLAALFLVGGPSDCVPLWRIIAIGDFLNHAIMTEGEVAGAFVRLSARGLIRRESERIGVTRAGYELASRAYDQAEGNPYVFWMDRLGPLLVPVEVGDADLARCRDWIKRRHACSVQRHAANFRELYERTKA